MNCKACDKQFTGIVSYNQHVASDKHKKKMMLFQNNNTPNESFPVSSQSSSEPQAHNINAFPCDTCAMNFYSLSDFMQHSSSQEHAKKVLNKISQNAMVENGPICNSTTDDFPNNGSGTNLDLSSKLNKDFNLSYYSRCDLCDKCFSGPESYKQHIDSERHRKKSALLSPNASQMENQKNYTENVLSSNTCEKTLNDPLYFQQCENIVHTTTTLTESNSGKVSTSNNSCFNLNSLVCEICNMACTGPIPYNQHLQSKVHLKNVQRKQLLIQLNKIEEKENRQDVTDSKSKQITPWYCEICSKNCSGPEPYREHISSSTHMKNVAKTGAPCEKTLNDPLHFQQCENIVHTTTTLTESNSGKVSTSSNSCFNLNSLVCEICDMTCSGPIPYNQHFQSKVHLKNVGRKQLLIQLNKIEESRQDVTDSKSKQITPWYCEICSKNCSGPEPYREHINSSNHMKNVAKSGVQEIQNEIRSIMIQSPGDIDIFSNKRLATADFNMMEHNHVSSVSQMTEKNVSDSLLSDASTSFLTVDLSNLNLTFFKVGEEIDFDKNEKSDIDFSEMDTNDMEEDDDEETSYDDMPSP